MTERSVTFNILPPLIPGQKATIRVTTMDYVEGQWKNSNHLLEAETDLQTDGIPDGNLLEWCHAASHYVAAALMKEVAARAVQDIRDSGARSLRASDNLMED